MSTHGCLKIRRRGEKRSILLHTPHSGYLIPETVSKAPVKAALARWHRFVVDDLLAKYREFTRRQVEKEIASHAFEDGLDWPPSVAAMIIAARPNFLDPIPPAFVRDLPEWGGQDAPVTLVLGSADTWTMSDDKQTWCWDPYAAIVEAIWKDLHPGEETAS